MASFDQRGQHVYGNQYIAGGDINFGAVRNQMAFITELEKLQEEMAKARQAGILDEEVAIDADYQLTKAIQQAKKAEPNKKTILEHLSGAKTLIAGVTAVSELVSTLSQAIESVQELVQQLF